MKKTYTKFDKLIDNYDSVSKGIIMFLYAIFIIWAIYQGITNGWGYIK